MNFLAHMHLAEPTPDAIIGNVIADLIRAPDFAALPESIQAGVRTHRRIDGYTDSHPAVQTSIRRISAEWGWFSGIVIDIYYDHILATTWPTFSDESLRDFADRMYDVLQHATPYVDAGGRQFLTKMRETDRLVQYGTVEGITDTLARVSERIAVRIPKRALPLQDAVPQLVSLRGELGEDFARFYPELRAFAASLT